jgi:hypothetical protein
MISQRMQAKCGVDTADQLSAKSSARTQAATASPGTQETSMKMQLIRTFLALAAVCPVHGVGAHDADNTAGKLGTVHFKVGCNAAAQREFDLAMAYYHSFAWEDIKAPLDRTLQADGACGMVHWLRALASLDNPFGWPGNVSAKTLVDGAALMEQARKTGLASQRERDYVDALAVFFQDVDKLNHTTRAKALESGLESVAAKYTEDTEAAILYSLVLSANFDPTDKQYNNQLRAAKLLEPIFAKQPEHPGAAHYLIHSYDYPPLAAQGLPSAQRYSKIAPAAAHAQHMLFAHLHRARRGALFGQSRRTRHRRKPTRLPGPKRHANDTWSGAHLQMGHRAAQAVRDSTIALLPRPDNLLPAPRCPVQRYRHDWPRAQRLGRSGKQH